MRQVKFFIFIRFSFLGGGKKRKLNANIRDGLLLLRRDALYRLCLQHFYLIERILPKHGTTAAMTSLLGTTTENNKKIQILISFISTILSTHD